MDDRILTQFITLAETLHFGRAAQACHVSPSSLSRSIQALESEIGADLFERDNRHVSLTRQGKAFLTKAQALLKHWQEVQYSLHEEGAALSGELKIFCSVTASYSFLYDILHDFRKKQANIEIKLNTGDPAQGIARLRDRQEDIAIAASPDKLPKDVDFRLIQRTPLQLITSRDSAELYHRNPRRFWQSAQMILSMEGLSRERSQRWLNRSRLNPPIYAQVAGNEALGRMVALGFGVGVVPEIVLENSPLRDRVTVLPQGITIGDFDVGLFALKKRLQDPIVSGFWGSQ